MLHIVCFLNITHLICKYYWLSSILLSYTGVISNQKLLLLFYLPSLYILVCSKWISSLYLLDSYLVITVICFFVCFSEVVILLAIVPWFKCGLYIMHIMSILVDNKRYYQNLEETFTWSSLKAYSELKIVWYSFGLS